MTDVPQPGERFVWQIPGVEFGPIYMTVKKVIQGQRPRVIFDCVDQNGRAFRKPRRQYLPLSANIRRQDWTESDLREVQQ